MSFLGCVITFIYGYGQLRSKKKKKGKKIKKGKIPTMGKILKSHVLLVKLNK